MNFEAFGCIVQWRKAFDTGNTDMITTMENYNLIDTCFVLEKAEEIKDQISNIWIILKSKESLQKHLFLLY